MKKIFVAAAAAVALATPAMAFEVKWGGDFQNRLAYVTDGDLFTNSGLSSDTTDYFNRATVSLSYPGVTPAPTPAPNTKKNSGESDYLADIKYRASLTATDDDKKVKGVLGFEFGSRKYGASGADFGGDDNVFELMHAYVDFAVPFDPAARLLVGLQPVGYNKFVWSDNAAGLKYAAKRDKLAYSLGWFRNDVNDVYGIENKDLDDDFYGIDATYTIDKGNSVGAFAYYMESGEEAAAAGTFGVAATTFLDKEIWYGLNANAQVGEIFLGGTAIYLDGEVNADNGASLDRKAYLLNAEASTKIDKTMLKLGYLYASGDDDATDDDLENFDSIDVYTGGYGSAVLFANLADDNAPINSFYVQDKGLSLLYLGADYSLSDKASVGASYLWWNTAEDIDGADAGTDGEDDLGHEVAVRASYQVAQGLVASINAGYLIGGDAWDELSGTDDADNVFRSDVNFRFKF